ncbi:NAD(P)H-dependent oxidoreductase [Ilumatobacter sp.]|uniref:NAD(P)H-dependent oxidoreductase n=1 Tax=Ilumatobacter sp. TaxID=1967498 RepID=UPI003B5225E8
MRAALVVAHPNPDSLTHALARRARTGLAAGGCDVEVLDLCAEGFRAAMTATERAAYHGERPVIDPVVERHVEVVTAVDALVFVYPTWWSGLPAVLKGWLERVMVPGVGFRFDERTGAVRPGLTDVRTIVGISTYGSPRWYVAAVNDNGRRTLTRALRMSCGPRTSTRWLGLYGVDGTDRRTRLEFAARVERTLADLGDRGAP